MKQAWFIFYRILIVVISKSTPLHGCKNHSSRLNYGLHYYKTIRSHVLFPPIIFSSISWFLRVPLEHSLREKGLLNCSFTFVDERTPIQRSRDTNDLDADWLFEFNRKSGGNARFSQVTRTAFERSGTDLNNFVSLIAF